MKIGFFLIIFSICQNSFAMGARPVFPGNPMSANENQHVNDIEETTSGINQFTRDRGHQDQQMMEEKEIKLLKEKEAREEKVEKKVEEPISPKKMKINRE